MRFPADQSFRGGRDVYKFRRSVCTGHTKARRISSLLMTDTFGRGGWRQSNRAGTAWHVMSEPREPNNNH